MSRPVYLPSPEANPVRCLFRLRMSYTLLYFVVIPVKETLSLFIFSYKGTTPSWDPESTPVVLTKMSSDQNCSWFWYLLPLPLCYIFLQLRKRKNSFNAFFLFFAEGSSLKWRHKIRATKHWIQVINFSGREMSRENISKVNFVGEICIKNILGVENLRTSSVFHLLFFVTRECNGFVNRGWAELRPKICRLADRHRSSLPHAREKP